MSDTGVRPTGAILLEFDSVEIGADMWLVEGLGVGATWFTGELAGGGALGTLVCETLTLGEYVGAALGGALGAAAGAGAGAGLGVEAGAGLAAALGGGLGGGLLGALDSWRWAKQKKEESSRTAARERLESRIKHLVPTTTLPTESEPGML